MRVKQQQTPHNQQKPITKTAKQTVAFEKEAIANDNTTAFRVHLTFGEIIEKALIILTKLFYFLRHLILLLLGGQRTISWLQICMIGLLIFIAYKKEMQFQLNFKTPFSEDTTTTKTKDKGIADDIDERAKSIFGFGKTNSHLVNLAAPISPDYLKDDEVEAYVQRFSAIAKTEQGKYGIPASINMAQALIESRAGDSRLAKTNNNHFGMKCFSNRCKKGHCSNFTDDTHKDFFRKYKSAWESWREHSKMIATGHYKPLLENRNDYKAWANGLSDLGYATDKQYTDKLIYIIEKYKLYELDK